MFDLSFLMDPNSGGPPGGFWSDWGPFSPPNGGPVPTLPWDPWAYFGSIINSAPGGPYGPQTSGPTYSNPGSPASGGGLTTIGPAFGQRGPTTTPGNRQSPGANQSQSQSGGLNMSALMAGLGGPRLGPQPVDPNALPGQQRLQDQGLAQAGLTQPRNGFGVANPNPNGLTDLHGFLNALLGQGTQF